MKRVVFLGCNNDQIKYLKQLRIKKFNIIGFDKNENAPGKKLCDYFFNIPYNDYKKIIDKLKIFKFNKQDLIFSAAQHHALFSLAKIAIKFGIKFHNIKTINFILDKIKLAKVLKLNKINYPKSYIIKTNKDLKKIKLKKNKKYFLKSDYGKTPKYIFIFSDKDPIPKLPKKDEFFKKYFILQEEFIGTHYRLNIINNRIFIFLKINDNEYVSKKKIDSYFAKKIKKKLINFVKKYELQFNILKVDIIISDKNWTIIDLGLDPPTRLLKQFIFNNINFYEKYIDLILFKKKSFAKYYNKLKNVKIKFQKNKVYVEKF